MNYVRFVYDLYPDKEEYRPSDWEPMAAFALSVRDAALEECMNIAESYDADRVATAIRAKIGGK